MNENPNTSENMEQDMQSSKDALNTVNNARNSANQLRNSIQNGRNRGRVNPSRGSKPGKKSADALRSGSSGVSKGGTAGIGQSGAKTGATKLMTTGAKSGGAAAAKGGAAAVMASPAGPFIIVAVAVILLYIFIANTIKSGTGSAVFNRMLLTDPLADESFFSRLFGGNSNQTDNWDIVDTTMEDVEDKQNELANIVNEYIMDARAACENKIREHCEAEGLDADRSLENVIDNTWSGSGEYDDGDGNGNAAGGAQGAADWARRIAADDDFCYGLPGKYGGHANRCGCYFCGTNTRIKGKKYAKTYNCITFVSAAYAHGANDPILLAKCKSGGLPISPYSNVSGTKLSGRLKKTFKVVGRCKDLKQSDLETGDVILHYKGGSFHHAYMYVGDGDIAEATRVSKTACWGPKSIRVENGTAAKRLKRSGNSSGNSIVIRYIGTGGGSGGIQGAISWAVDKANDNSWGYPSRKRAGCYICGTSKTKEYTCMPFITAAYAHGAGDKEVLKICKKGHSLSTTDSNFKLKCFKKVGRCKDLKYSDLQAGDILVQYSSDNNHGHMCMYIGDGKLVHATGHSTGIQVTKNAKKYFNQLHNCSSRSGEGKKNYVMRYVGNGSGNGNNNGGGGGTSDGSQNVKTYGSYHKVGSIGGGSVKTYKNLGSHQGYSIGQSMTWMGNNTYVVSFCDSGAKNTSNLVKFRNGKAVDHQKSSTAKHGNGLCYNSRTGLLWSSRATSGGGDMAVLTKFDASTLKEKGTKRLRGTTTSSIGYDAGTNRYVLNHTNDICILNSNFKILKRVNKKHHVKPQDSNCYNGLALCVNQNSSIDIYRMANGKYCGTITTSLGELESVCVDDNGYLLLMNPRVIFKSKKKITSYVNVSTTPTSTGGSGSSGGSSGGNSGKSDVIPGRVNKPVGSKLTTSEAVDNACAWAEAVANNNDYHYGQSSWAHHHGCTFCGTQGKKIKSGGSPEQVKNTYCCNPFVTAAYCHGAGAKQYVNCKNSKKINLANDSSPGLTSGGFKRVSKTTKSALKKGDVLLTPRHAMLYIGNGKIAHASGHDNGKRDKKWNNSIRVSSVNGNWGSVTKIYRFTGTGKVTPASEWPGGGGGRSIDTVKKAKGMSDTQFKHEKEIWLYMRKAGYSEAATAGALGNLWFESGYNPNAINKAEQAKYGDKICGIGIEQWSNGRNPALRNFAKKKGKKWNNLSVQCDFMIYEIKKSYKKVSPTSQYAVTKGSQTNAYNAAREWLRVYVYSTKADDYSWYDKRGNWAKDVYKRYHGVSAEGIFGEGGTVGVDGGGYAVSSRQMNLILSTFSVYEDQLFGGSRREEEKEERKEKVVQQGGNLVGAGGRFIGTVVGGAKGGWDYIFHNDNDKKNFKGFVDAVADGGESGGNTGESTGREIGEIVTEFVYTKVESFLSRKDTVNDLRGIMQNYSSEFFIITYGDTTQDYDEYGNPVGLPYYTSITIEPADIKYIMQNAFGIDPDGIYRTNQVDRSRSAGGGDGSAVAGAGAEGAIEWAKKIADDNRYTYGGYQCHTCNGTAREYVCTTFVKGAYAHGAKDSEVLDWCKHNKYGFVNDLHNAMKKSKRWKSMGAIPISKMQKGDVIVFGRQHVEMYYGGGKFIGSHHVCANRADDINYKTGWGGYTDVMRYVYNNGGGSGNYTAAKGKVGEASGGESGKTGQKAGDQNGKEVTINKYVYTTKKSYRKWKYCFRLKDASKANQLAAYCEAACNNNNIGYDQKPDGGRGELYNLASKAGFNFGAINKKCETSCTPLALACAKATGISGLSTTTDASGIYNAIKKVNSSYKSKGKTPPFEILTFTEKEWKDYKKNLKRGDIITTGGHTAVVL